MAGRAPLQHESEAPHTVRATTRIEHHVASRDVMRTTHKRPSPQPHHPATRQARRVHLEAAGALDVHEERVGCLYEALQLVLGCLRLGVGVEQVKVDAGHF